MSALTKVFVVLHVVLSMLLVAGLVVFVNKVEDFNKVAITAKQKEDREHAAKEAALVETRDVRAERDKAVAEANDRAATSAGLAEQKDAEIAKGKTDLQAAMIATDKVNSQLQNMTLALKAAQDAVSTNETTIVDLRKTGDDVLKKYNDAMLAISDLNNKLDVTRTSLKYASEQIAALQDENAQMRDRASKPAAGGAAPAGAPGAPGVSGVLDTGLPTGAAGAPANVSIHGVVRATKVIGDVPYATISVGSADQVTKGMQFKVLDRSQFMGYLTVDSVEPNESTGHLSGPNVSGIQKGSQVLTQWQ